AELSISSVEARGGGQHYEPFFGRRLFNINFRSRVGRPQGPFYINEVVLSLFDLQLGRLVSSQL
ncbi:MAG: hypothetical protein LBP95_03590, partial [Deltaproteobacteria bacterium]|nr:hypothetical protein [Deltaproteobacteria bacterium]